MGNPRQWVGLQQKGTNNRREYIFGPKSFEDRGGMQKRLNYMPLDRSLQPLTYQGPSVKGDDLCPGACLVLFPTAFFAIVFDISTFDSAFVLSPLCRLGGSSSRFPCPLSFSHRILPVFTITATTFLSIDFVRSCLGWICVTRGLRVS